MAKGEWGDRKEEISEGREMGRKEKNGSAKGMESEIILILISSSVGLAIGVVSGGFCGLAPNP